MARIYLSPEGSTPDVEGAPVQSLHPQARRAVLVFWGAFVLAIAGAVALFFAVKSYLATDTAALVALLAATAATVGLLAMYHSMANMRLVTDEEATDEKRLLPMLEQLDDRFAVFTGIWSGGAWIAHMVVGPTGMFVIDAVEGTAAGDEVAADDVSRIMVAREAAMDAVRGANTGVAVDVSPVLCAWQAGETHQIPQGVWVINPSKLPAALLRRSASQGAITHNITDTGAFNRQAVQSGIIEAYLAERWKMARRKTRTDFSPATPFTD